MNDDSSLGACIGRGAQIVNGCINNPISILCKQVRLQEIACLLPATCACHCSFLCCQSSLQARTKFFMVGLLFTNDVSFRCSRCWSAFSSSLIVVCVHMCVISWTVPWSLCTGRVSNAAVIGTVPSDR